MTTSDETLSRIEAVSRRVANDVIREQIAEAIHNSSPFGASTAWRALPESSSNPQRVVALSAADAVIRLYSPAQRDAVDAVKVMKLLMSDGAGNIITPPVPDELCGIKGGHSYRTQQAESCVFLPDHEGEHSWEL